MRLPIYLDNHATTPVDSRVLDAMMPFFTEQFGNAASRNHSFGWTAARAVERAREQVAELIGASAKDIIFTSGATESNNLALKGAAAVYRDRGNHIITVVTEHKAVLDACSRLERDGYRVTKLGVNRDGLIDLDELEAAISSSTILISIMAANNEIGVVQPLEEVGRIAKQRGVIFHTDAVQAAGKIPFDVDRAGVDLASLTAHKMYGPKGIGALYARRRNPRVELAPLFDGGGQERGARAGTLNVPGIVGFGMAAEICRREMVEEGSRMRQMRDRLWTQLRERLDGLHLNGSMTDRLPQNLNVSFSGIHGDALIVGIDDIAVSSGAACTSAKIEPSHVLQALGLDHELAQSSIRFGLGRFNTDEEIDYVAGKVALVVTRLREMSPVYHLSDPASGGERG